MQRDGARPSLFEVRLYPPPAIQELDLRDAPFRVRAANLPESNITPIVVKYFGRDVKFAGNRTFPDWTTTILNDEDFKIRHQLELWHQFINSVSGNLRGSAGSTGLLTGGATSASKYKSTADVIQYGKDGVAIRTYQFVDIWPNIISPIELSWDTADAIEEYTCTWSFNYWFVRDGFGLGNTGSIDRASVGFGALGEDIVGSLGVELGQIATDSVAGAARDVAGAVIGRIGSLFS